MLASIYRILFILAIVPSSGSSALSQQEANSQQQSDMFGSFAGTVQDSVTGAPVIGAIVELKSAYLGTASTLGGHFEISRIPPGRHLFIFSCVGYDSVIIDNIEISAGTINHLNVSLPWQTPTDFADRARRELSKGQVHLWQAGLIIGEIPDSAFTSKYGFQYFLTGCDPTGVPEHNKVIEEYLQKRNGAGWRELFEKEWSTVLLQRNGKQ